MYGARVIEAAIAFLLEINPHRFEDVLHFREELRQRERVLETVGILREERRVARAEQRRLRMRLVNRVIEVARRRWRFTSPPAA